MVIVLKNVDTVSKPNVIKKYWWNFDKVSSVAFVGSVPSPCFYCAILVMASSSCPITYGIDEVISDENTRKEILMRNSFHYFLPYFISLRYTGHENCLLALLVMTVSLRRNLNLRLVFEGLFDSSLSDSSLSLSVISSGSSSRTLLRFCES